MVASYAASSALVKQIEQGAPADVFISADLDWMDYGAQKKLIKDDTRLNLLGNKLVEEAGELGRARTREEVVSEAADLLYFTLTAVAGAGADLSDVERELHRRSLRVTRRCGDAKKSGG